MTHAILDTHTLVWFLQKDKNLSKKALKLILKADVTKVIPFIVLCEIHYLHARGRFATSAQEVMLKLHEVDHFEISSHTANQVPYLMPELEIHDALIVGTALSYRESNSGDVVIVSRDKEIKNFSPLPVIWDESS